MRSPRFKATLDGTATETGAVYEAKFMLLWLLSEDAAPYVPRPPGVAKWVEITITADPSTGTSCSTTEKKFWLCVQFGDRGSATEAVDSYCQKITQVGIRSKTFDECVSVISNGTRCSGVANLRRRWRRSDRCRVCRPGRGTREAVTHARVPTLRSWRDACAPLRRWARDPRDFRR